MASSPREHTYVHVWPIEDMDLPISTLRVEAAAALDMFAAHDGARLTGPPRWLVSGDRLVCMVAAVPVDPPDPGEVDEAAVLRLVEFDWTDEQAANAAGCGVARVAQIRTAAGLEPGAGVRDLVDMVAVERACTGDRHFKLNRAEKRVAMRHLRRRGASVAEIASRLGITPRTVQRSTTAPESAEVA